jgi:hypothetical protein
MSITASGERVEPCQPKQFSADDIDVTPKRGNLLLQATALMSSCLGIVVLIVVTLSKTRTAAPSEPPVRFLPGNPLPPGVQCLLAADRYDDCRAAWDGKVIAITYDNKTRQIFRILVPGHDYRIGDLILTWGTPTGLAHSSYGCNIVMFWGQRAVHLHTCALQMASHVDAIEYTLVQQPHAPWRGLTSPH